VAKRPLPPFGDQRGTAFVALAEDLEQQLSNRFGQRHETQPSSSRKARATSITPQSQVPTPAASTEVYARVCLYRGGQESVDNAQVSTTAVPRQPSASERGGRVRAAELPAPGFSLIPILIATLQPGPPRDDLAHRQPKWGGIRSKSQPSRPRSRPAPRSTI
jgi:hypothetical protein